MNGTAKIHFLIPNYFLFLYKKRNENLIFFPFIFMKIKSAILISILIAVLGSVIYIGYKLSKQKPNNVPTNNEVVLKNVILEKNEDTTKVTEKILQGILYSSPIKIRHFDNFLLEIYPKTHEKPQERSINKNETEEMEQTEDYDEPKSNERMDKKVYTASSYAGKYYFNLMFMDKDYQNNSLLLDKKALILDYKSPASWFDDMQMPDSTNLEQFAKYKAMQKKIQELPFFVYRIVTEDSNNDGKLSIKDYSDYYISDVVGKNLKQITKNINVISFEFLEEKRALLFIYTDRTKNKQKSKQKRFALYSFDKNTFSPLSDLHEGIKDAEKIMNK